MLAPLAAATNLRYACSHLSSADDRYVFDHGAPERGRGETSADVMSDEGHGACVCVRNRQRSCSRSWRLGQVEEKEEERSLVTWSGPAFHEL